MPFSIGIFVEGIVSWVPCGRHHRPRRSDRPQRRGCASRPGTAYGSQGEDGSCASFAAGLENEGSILDDAMAGDSVSRLPPPGSCIGVFSDPPNDVPGKGNLDTKLPAIQDTTTTTTAGPPRFRRGIEPRSTAVAATKSNSRGKTEGSIQGASSELDLHPGTPPRRT